LRAGGEEVVEAGEASRPWRLQEKIRLNHEEHIGMNKVTLAIVFAWALFCHAALASAALEILAEKAAIRTEGGPNPGGGWNLWSNGRVGQPVRIVITGMYHVVIRARGSSAAGVWPEMALMVDGQAIKIVSVVGEPADYPFDVNLTAGIHEIAAAFLNDAVIGKEDRNLYLSRITISPPPRAAEPILVTEKEQTEAMEQREQEILADTQAAIEKNRKADAEIQLLDAAGQPIPGIKVSCKQISHNFLFGCNIYMFDHFKTEDQNAAYKKRFQELFNYATVGFYWRWYEPERGRPNYEYTDKVVEWCRDHEIRMKGHPLLWGDSAGVPTWSNGQPAPEVQRRRVKEIMQRYQGRIEFWEVVNEPSHLAEPKINDPYRWAQETDPGAYLIINDYHVLADGAPNFFQLLTVAKQNEVPFAGIGIQAHEPRNMRFPLDQVQKILTHYASLDKELHITEFTPASSGQKITGSHREGVWDELSQADYAVKFYRLCFAQPSLRAITWWDLCDKGSWLPGGGMLRADLSPKPVYEQLKRLIQQEWKTTLEVTTDAEGRGSFRGFCGKYRFTIETPDGKVEREIHLKKGEQNKIEIRLPASKDR
jgi:GH35 family endo-1,4-beta-xylanase